MRSYPTGVAWRPQRALPGVHKFTPFDPASKRAETAAQDADGHEIVVMKGAPAALATLAPFDTGQGRNSRGCSV
jgi:magnesium-transporting ATPase (P-type)